jgi:uncharacterized protein YndB with AHSA1/START domain
VTGEPGARPITLEVSRRFAAPPEQVFDAWLDPAALGKWLFATPGGVMQLVEVDPRIGGRFRVDEQRGDVLATHFGEYLELDRPRRLVFAFATDRAQKPTVVTVEIAPAGDGCVLTLTHEMDPQWADYAERARNGWTQILEGLARTLADARTLVIARTLAAPRSLVWQAWSDPAHLPRWWGPKGFSTVVEEIEVRPGGVWRFVMKGPDGAAFKNRIIFQEVVAPERLVYAMDDDGVGEFPVFDATVTFGEQGEKTLLTMRMVFDSATTREAMVKFGAVEGGESTVDCLEEHLASMAATASGS